MWVEFRGHGFVLTMACNDARDLLTLLDRVDVLPYGLARLQRKLELGLGNEEGQHLQGAFWREPLRVERNAVSRYTIPHETI